MPLSYLPILIFLVLAILLPIAGLLVAWIVRPDVGGRVKALPYECGVDPEGDVRERYTARYYIVAILFVIFDVETIFLFPWAVIYDQVLLFGFIEMAVFLGILILGWVYAWKKGALEWV
jgi:NADH-quinone oxidoreductase subunit A